MNSKSRKTFKQLRTVSFLSAASISFCCYFLLFPMPVNSNLSELKMATSPRYNNDKTSTIRQVGVDALEASKKNENSHKSLK
jgi:hypothetical protein